MKLASLITTALTLLSLNTFAGHILDKNKIFVETTGDIELIQTAQTPAKVTVYKQCHTVSSVCLSDSMGYPSSACKTYYDDRDVKAVITFKENTRLSNDDTRTYTLSCKKNSSSLVLTSNSYDVEISKGFLSSSKFTVKERD